MLAGIVLAGGAGTRFGQPKATVVLDGRTLVERAVDMLEALCDEVVVVSRAEIQLPPIGRVVLDRPGPDCPLNALVTGLEALTAGDVLVLGCDLPRAGPVLDRLRSAPGNAVAIDAQGRLQPLCAKYRRVGAFTAAEALLQRGERRLLALLDHLDIVTVAGTDAELVNINTPLDLAGLDEGDAAVLRPQLAEIPGWPPG